MQTQRQSIMGTVSKKAAQTNEPKKQLPPPNQQNGPLLLLQVAHQNQVGKTYCWIHFKLLQKLFQGHSFEFINLHDQFKNTKEKLHSKATLTKIRRDLENREKILEIYIRDDAIVCKNEARDKDLTKKCQDLSR